MLVSRRSLVAFFVFAVCSQPGLAKDKPGEEPTTAPMFSLEDKHAIRKLVLSLSAGGWTVVTAAGLIHGMDFNNALVLGGVIGVPGLIQFGRPFTSNIAQNASRRPSLGVNTAVGPSVASSETVKLSGPDERGVTKYLEHERSGKKVYFVTTMDVPMGVEEVGKVEIHALTAPAPTVEKLQKKGIPLVFTAQEGEPKAYVVDGQTTFEMAVDQDANICSPTAFIEQRDGNGIFLEYRENERQVYLVTRQGSGKNSRILDQKPISAIAARNGLITHLRSIEKMPITMLNKGDGYDHTTEFFSPGPDSPKLPVSMENYGLEDFTRAQKTFKKLAVHPEGQIVLADAIAKDVGPIRPIEFIQRKPIDGIKPVSLSEKDGVLAIEAGPSQLEAVKRGEMDLVSLEDLQARSEKGVWVSYPDLDENTFFLLQKGEVVAIPSHLSRVSIWKQPYSNDIQLVTTLEKTAPNSRSTFESLLATQAQHCNLRRLTGGPESTGGPR